jgi:hypothetical protein
MLPAVTPVGAVAVIVVAVIADEAAATPLKRTVVAPVRPVPVITTDEPAEI